ncbi:T-complex protein 11-domain-containing protein [Radiomyces spectabilis]|uniref:T-complex protein 11-domain-containing protein n=1 Tax=Radiomyces spectabilis TaxID=64574 RepID=UPI00221EC58E|nr:T-complex protein 11-domain-containing protein [Radiomyces spectabilis]KAI8364648.1 T-complex protein 11-domain-containing protein [Radiomyces spectabilis]
MMERDSAGFFFVDALSLCQTSGRPYHLEKRFLHNVNYQTTTTTLQAAEIKRQAFLEARRQKLNQKFLQVTRVVKENQARKENRHLLFLRSLELAESKRNHHLEQRRSASKKSVERAKIIALQHHRKYQAEREQLRRHLEERLEKTNTRRLHLLKLPKSSLLKTHKMREKEETKTMSKTSTTTVPSPEKQRKQSWLTLLQAFRDLGLPNPLHRDTWQEFGPLGDLLRKPQVIIITSKILNVALRKTDKECSRKRARVLLTAYMILMCPAEVLQDAEGAQEQQLRTVAKETLENFESWLQLHDDSAGLTAKRSFQDSWRNFYQQFEAWRTKDHDALVNNVFDYCIELLQLKTLLAENDDPSPMMQVEQQLSEVKSRLRQIGGQSALDRLAVAEQNLDQGSVSEDGPSSTPRSPDKIDKTVNPEEFTKLLSSYAPYMSSAITNEQLVHELILDPEFKLQKYRPRSDLEDRVKTMATKAFFDKIAEEYDRGDWQTSIAPLLQDVREQLVALVRPGTAVHSSICETLDINLLEQQSSKNIFDIDKTLTYIGTIMSHICAPVRDEVIHELPHLETMDRLHRILEILEDMTLDLANYRLRALRPHLMPIAVEYEQSKFAEKMGKGDLPNTTQWIAESFKRLYDAAAGRDPEGILPPKQCNPSLDDTFEEAMISLIMSPDLITVDTCPETLVMDRQRLLDYQNQAQAVTMVAALLMLAKNVNTSKSAELHSLSDKLFLLLEDHSTTVDHLAAEIDAAVAVRDESRLMMRSMVDKTLSHSDSLYSLLSRRVGSVLKSYIHSSGEFVTPAILTSYGLEYVDKPLKSLCRSVLALVLHHRQVYNTYYRQIIRNISVGS